jgi:putative hydrolase of the HAD superfamily
MPLRGIFFDLYGTLLAYGDMRQAWDDWLATLHAGLESQGLTVDRAAFAIRCDRFFERAEPPDGADGSTPLDRRLRELCRTFGLFPGAAALREIGEAAAEAWQAHVTVDPEAGSILRMFRGGRVLALVSNFDHPPHVRKVLSRHALAEAFGAIVVSAEVGFKKPDPRIFQVALARTGLRAEDVVHVGDAAEDVRGAIRAGIRPILIRRNGTHALDPPFDFHAEPVAQSRSSARPLDGVPVIARLSDLPAILSREYR